ncbi:MAG: hypothetical protein D6712_17430 [Chloroflexi bacterium]|nr:MAG: hypothetical protein D6712_17430 [Chloroflexota bacterium]
MLVRFTGLLLLARVFAPIAVAIFAYITLASFFSEVAAVVDTHRPAIESDLATVRAELATLENSLDTLADSATAVIDYTSTLTSSLALPTINTSLEFGDFSIPLPFANGLQTALRNLRGALGTISSPFDELAIATESLSRVAEHTNSAWLHLLAMFNDLDALMSAEPTKDNPNPGGWALRLQTLFLLILVVFIVVYVSFALESLMNGWRMFWRGQL